MTVTWTNSLPSLYYEFTNRCLVALKGFFRNVTTSVFSLSITFLTNIHTHARTHARKHARTHAHAHTHTHTHTHKCGCVSRTISTCSRHLSNIGLINHYLTQTIAERVVNAMLTSRLDYCNALLFGNPITSIDCFICCTATHISQCIASKIAVLIF